jgi:tRNA-specific 2-thiouridylase
MSGGVDSSTAAAMLKEAGHDLIGFSMQLWDPRRGAPACDAPAPARCRSREDLRDAGNVAARLGIPHYVVNFQKEFERTVVKAFIEDYRNGLTPSPCVVCNSRVKFDLLVRLAAEEGAAQVATGHYARTAYDEDRGRQLLLRARDRQKDQSYFLFALSQPQLARAVFPLGDLEKDQVRRLARSHGLEVAGKSESQEICFIPDGDYAAFIERHADEIAGPSRRINPFFPGRIVDRAGRTLGTHPGIHHFTIGQRRGLGIAHSSPLYVLEIRPEDNCVVVGERPLLDKRRCRVGRPNWISISALTDPLCVHAKIRSRHPAAPARIAPAEDGSVTVAFDSPQPAISPGQACVFYRNDEVVGGGWIERE